MANTTTGAIHRIEPTQSKDHNGKTYYERQLIIDATRYDQFSGEAKYPNHPAFSFSGDRCAELDAYKPNEIVTISFEVQGRKYIDKTTKEEKVFNKVAAYKIERYQTHQPAAQSLAPQSQVPTSVPVTTIPSATAQAVTAPVNDDLPF